MSDQSATFSHYKHRNNTTAGWWFEHSWYSFQLALG